MDQCKVYKEDRIGFCKFFVGPIVIKDTILQSLNRHQQEKIFEILRVSFINSSFVSMVPVIEENEERKSINNKIITNDIITRVYVAQCKIYSIQGMPQKKKSQQLQDQGFRELYQLRNYKEAYYPLGCYYYDQHDYERAYFWFGKDGSNLSKYKMAIILLQDDYHKEKALNYMFLSAEEDCYYAQFMLGLYYQHGILVRQDLDRSEMWYERSALLGFAEAQIALCNLILIRCLDKEGEKDDLLSRRALFWLFKAANQENASALIRLGTLHEEGILVEKNHSKAIEYYKKATTFKTTKSVQSFAHYLLGINYQLGDLGLAKDLKTAKKHLVSSANMGHIPAQRTLGLIYAQQNGDSIKATELLERAASQNDARSLGMLAAICTNQDERSALYERAAKGGSISAQLSYAILLQTKGQHKDALKWFEVVLHSTQTKNTIPDHRRATSHFNIGLRNTARLMVARYRCSGWNGVIEKDPLLAFQEFYLLSTKEEFSGAYYWLAACYEEGVLSVVEPDLDLAFKYYEKAALANDKDGQFQVAYMLSNGYHSPQQNMVIKDRKQAFSWYLKAAKAGHAVAQYSVGLYYENGLCLAVDTEKAIQWYKSAASQGLTFAMVRLARLFVIQDKINDACEWLEKAISKGDISALRELATIYKNGLTASENMAFNLYQQAADKGDAMSWHALSTYFYTENDDEIMIENVKKFDKAVYCLEKSEELGYTVAGLDLANIYYRHEMWDEALQVYTRLIKIHNADSAVGSEARIKMANIVIFENSGTKQEQEQSFIWLKDMKATAKIHELLGYALDHGIGTPVDKQTCLQHYMSCLDKEDEDENIYRRAYSRIIKYYMEETKEYDLAYAYLHNLELSLNDCRLKYYLGCLSLHGLGGAPQSFQKGVYWLKEAADEGDGDAAYKLGRQSNNENESRHRYEQGAENGHPGCMRALALLLLADENANQENHDDYVTGLLEKAAQLRDTEALYQLGMIYEQKDINYALNLYLQAASNNHELAMVKAGEVLGNIMGKYAEGIPWLQKAVDLKDNLKAKIILISCALQGFTASNDDDYHFQVLRSIIDEETRKQHSYSEQDYNKRKEGLGLAYYVLGQCYELGKGTDSNYLIAIDWYHQSISTSQHTDAMWRLGIIHSTLENDNVQALQWYRNAAEAGRHVESQYQLGLFHLNGLGGLEVNRVAAKKYFSKASEQGHPLATYELARLYWSKEDYIYAFELYKLAATTMRVPDALRELGHLSHTGSLFNGVTIIPQDFKRAFAYYCEAAHLGDPIAALMVGNYFEEGYLKQELGQDCERALQWYESAYRLNVGGLAELAIGKLKHTMANKIDDSIEAEDMREEAYVWFESAAATANDDATSEYAKVMIALYHLNGWGRKTQDTKAGFDMLLRIAESGGKEAFVSVARCYEKGIGTDYNIEKSIEYWEMAADLNDESALIRIKELYDEDDRITDCSPSSSSFNFSSSEQTSNN